ncbi:phage head spike fiber domain-containing protein [Endozoicomonas sp. 2B-B]
MSTTISDRLEAATQKAESASDTLQQVTEGDDQAWIPTESGNPIPSIRNVQRQWNDQVEGDLTLSKQYRDESGSNAVRAEAAADRADQIADLETVRDALRLAAVPAPDFHLPLISDLRIEEGFGPADQVDVSAAQDGSVMVDLPSRSASFSRSSNATGTNKSGVVTAAGINVPRFEAEGLRHEEDQTNLMILSNSVDLWGEVNGNTITDFIDGGFNARRFEFEGVMGDESAYGLVPVTALQATNNGDKFTYSVLVRHLSGKHRIRIRFSNPEFLGDASLYVDTKEVSVFGSVVAEVKEEGDGWYLFSATILIGADTTEIRASVTQLSSGTENGSKIELKLPQFEKSAHASSRIPTTGAAATRAGDLILVDGAENFSQKGMTVFLSCRSDDVENGGIRLFEFYDGGIRTLFADWRSDKAINFGITGVASKIARTKVEDIGSRKDRVNVCLQFLPDQIKGFINGEESVMLNDATPLPSSTSMCIGSTKNGSYSINGHIQDFRIWHKALTLEQIAALGSA